MDRLYEFVQILICVFEAYLMFDFFGTFFNMRKIFQRRFCAQVIVLVVSACVYAVNAFDNSGINLIAMQIIYLALVLTVFEGGIFKRIAYDVIANVIMAGSEFLFIIILSVPSDFSLDSVEFGRFAMITNLIGIKTIAFILLNIIKRIPKNSGNRISVDKVLMFSIVPLSMLGIMTAIAYLNLDFDELPHVKYLLLISCILATVGNVVVFYVFDRYSLSVQMLRQQELMITRLELEQKHYEQIDEMNKEHSHLIHNIKHYLNVIGEAVAESAVSENAVDIRGILTELQVEFDNAEVNVFCKNPLINAILNEKKRGAERQAVRMEIMVEPEFSVKNVKETDIIAIIGNLLDNAVEAAAQCSEGYVKVFLFTQNDNSFSVIKTVNSYAGEIHHKEGNLVSSKQDKKFHGIGLKSVNSMLEKYDGYLDYFYDKNTFTSVAILSNNAKI